MQETEGARTSGKKEFYSLEEVADLLGVNYQLIYKLVRSGELAAARIGKVYRVSRLDLDHYLEQSKGHAGGGTCVVCGKVYHSQLSLKESCTECGEPICVDCWTRKKVRNCRAHSQSGKNGSQAVVAGSSGS